MGSHIFFVEKESDDSGHCVAGRRLYRVNSSRYKDDRFIGSEFGDLLITERVALCNFEAFSAFVGRDDKEGDYPALVTLGEIVKSKEQLFILLICLVEYEEIFLTLLVAVRIGESKLNTCDEFIKHEIEFKDQLIVLVKSEILNRVR